MKHTKSHARNKGNPFSQSSLTNNNDAAAAGNEKKICRPDITLMCE